MTDTETEVENLRKKLRDGRTITADGSALSSSASSDNEKQRAFQDVERDIEKSRGNNEQTGIENQGNRSNESGVIEVIKRVGRRSRRLGENNISSDAPRETIERDNERKLGNIVTSVPIPPRPEETLGEQTPKRRRGRPKKSEDDTSTQTQKKEFPVKTSRLTVREADELREPFKRAFFDDIGYIDEYLKLRLRGVGKDESLGDVWSTVDTDEEEAITNALFKFGQKSETVATGIRLVVEFGDYTVLAAFFIPRSIKTAQIMRDTIKPHKSRVLRGRIQNEHQDQ